MLGIYQEQRRNVLIGNYMAQRLYTFRPSWRGINTTIIAGGGDCMAIYLVTLPANSITIEPCMHPYFVYLISADYLANGSE